MIKVGEIRWTHNRLIKGYVLCKGDKNDVKKHGLINRDNKLQKEKAKTDFWQCLVLEDNATGNDELLGQIKFLYIGDLCDEF